MKPGRASVAGRRSSVMVSPTLQSATVLIAAVMKPISPGPRSSIGTIFGVNTPTCSTEWTAPDDIIRMRCPRFIRPSLIRTRMTTPRYWSYQLSTSSAFSGAFGSPFGAGSRVTRASSTPSMFSPVLALISTASEVSRPITSSICCFTRSGSAAGRSILFRIGTISWLASIAW